MKELKKLDHFYMSSVPIAYLWHWAKSLKGVNPPWRQFNSKINWGKEKTILYRAMNAVDCLSEQLSNSMKKLILICLGPLTNIGQLVSKNPSLSSKIERIIWYNESVKPLQGFNYECDKINADLVFKSGIKN